MRVYAITLLILITLAPVPISSDCRCKKARDSVTTLWGHIANGYVEQIVFKKLEGIVTDEAETPLAEALVEVYDHPEYNSAIHGQNAPKGEQKRIAACWTGLDGKFCFRGIKPGTYDLRVSRSSFNSTSIMLTLNPKHQKGTSKGIEVLLQAGT